jgi:ABC-type polysaccharide/polyol phosphate export permease
MLPEQTLVLGAPAARSRLRSALQDLHDGCNSYHVWGLLGWQDIRQRYRRSVIGPLWLTISTALMVSVMGYLYSGLFNQPANVYVPFIAAGFVVWAYLSTVLNEACMVFISSEQIIKQIRAPLTLHVCRMAWRNLLIFFHNALILAVVYIVFAREYHWNVLLLPLAVLLIAVNTVWVGLVLGILCTRFRDIAPIVANVVQIAFFVTPIMWLPELLEGRGLRWVADANPIYHFIEIIRAPILGVPIQRASWAVTLAVTAAGFGLAILALQKFRHRVPYWL